MLTARMTPKRMAINNMGLAIFNVDSYEYFAKNKTRSAYPLCCLQKFNTDVLAIIESVSISNFRAILRRPHLWICLRRTDVAQRAKGWYLVLWVRHFGLPFTPRARTDRMFNKKSKKLHKSSQRHVSLGIPTNIAVGSLGFRAELDIGPNGQRCHDSRGDPPDLTAILDENDVRASRIVFNDKGSEGQGLPVPGPSTSGAAVDGDGRGTGPIGECFRSLLSFPMFMWGYLYSICQVKMLVKLET